MTRDASVPVLAAPLVVLLLVVGCGSAARFDRLGLPRDHPVTQQELRRLPVAQLVYPGSRIVRVIGSDEHRQAGDHEPDPAFAGTVAVAPVGTDALLAWYDERLTRQGYRRATYYKLAGQSTGGAWTAPGDREQVQVGIFAPGSGAAGPLPRGQLGYEAIVVNYRITGPPPA